jgi:hypothetical protein
MKFNSRLTRARWAAIGAAVAVSLGVGGTAMIHAATQPSGPASVLVPVVPCRLVDSRAATRIGDLTSALPAGSTVTLGAHGPHGQCDLPTDAVALDTNVTIINLTAPTYVTAYPAGVTRPLIATIVGRPGAPVINHATIGLAANGNFSAYNNAGAIDIIIDITGYYTKAPSTGVPGAQGPVGDLGARGGPGTPGAMQSAWYPDPDGDGFGDDVAAADIQLSSSPVSGRVTNHCEAPSPTQGPGVAETPGQFEFTYDNRRVRELPNNIDENCDGYTVSFFSNAQPAALVAAAGAGGRSFDRSQVSGTIACGTSSAQPVAAETTITNDGVLLGHPDLRNLIFKGGACRLDVRYGGQPFSATYTWALVLQQ